jgi:hypothetical protein
MADNTRLNNGLGGDLIASDDINGVKYQRVKMALGRDGVNDGDISGLNPMPIVSNMDAFYRMRVSNPQTIFDSKQLSDNQPLFWDDAQTSGSGTGSSFNDNQASTTISVGNATAGTRVRQTFRHFNYQPGKSQLIIMTGIVGAAATGITKRLGLFNEGNGIFFEQAPTGMGVVVRTNTSGTPSDTRIPQASWNIDKMDGTGASGITLDYTKTLIYFMDFEWLGVGTVRFGVYVNGLPYYVHAVHNSNINTLVYMSTPNLPLRYEISNDGTGGAASLVHICTTVITEGGRQTTGIERALNRGVDTLITNNDANIYPLIGLRLKATHLGVFVRLLDYNILCTSTSEYAYYVIISPTVTGTALTWNDITNSGLQYTYGTNATTLSGGTVITTGLGSDTAQNRSGIQRVTESDLVIGSKIDGTPQEIYLGVQRLTGTTETFYSSMVWSETN